MKKADIGLIGLAVMGENLVMNMESKGFTVAVYNRTAEKVTNFVEGRAKGKNIIGAYSIEELVANLEKPRKVMLMVKAGQPVDDFIEKAHSAPGKGRHHHRRRQFPFPGYHPPHRRMWRARACITSAPAFPAARKARSRAPA